MMQKKYSVPSNLGQVAQLNSHWPNRGQEKGKKKRERKQKKIKNILLRPRKERQSEKEIYRPAEPFFKEAQLNPLQVHLINSLSFSSTFSLIKPHMNMCLHFRHVS